MKTIHSSYVFKQKSGHNLRKKANYQQVTTLNQPVTVNFIYILDEGKYFSNSSIFAHFQNTIKLNKTIMSSNLLIFLFWQQL